MFLVDGLTYYKADSTWWTFTLTLEESAARIVASISRASSQPNSAECAAAYALLIEIETWKAMCLHEQTGNAAKNPEGTVWNAFRLALDALNAGNDREAILSIMELKGFGSSMDEERGLRRAKRASAVLRFLSPQLWGVVDWRTIAILDNLKKADLDVARALEEAKKIKGKDLNQLKDTLDLVNEDWACEINVQYRAMRTAALPRTADVDMALFGLSMMVWPFRAGAAASTIGFA